MTVMGMLIYTLFWVLPFGKGKIGLLYNFSLARQNELEIKRVILSRRSASSESSLFFKAILKVEFRELYLAPHIQTKKRVFGPGDVLACPIIHRFVYQSANVPQTLSDPG